VHSLWSTLMVRTGNTVEALKAIDEAIRLKPGNAGFQAYRGQILAMMMRFKDAVAAFEAALQLDPEDQFTRIALARGHMMQGNIDAGIAQAGLALKSNPESVEATGMLGQLHLQRGEPAQALEHFDRLVRMTPSDARSWCSRGQVYMSLNRPADAERDFLKAVQLSPDEPNFLSQLAWHYRMTGRMDRLHAVMGDIHRNAPQVAQMLQLQMQMGAGPMAGLLAQGQGVLQRFIGAMR